VPDPRTTITELVTGLGMLGYEDIGAALAARPGEMVSVSPDLWSQLDRWHDGRNWQHEFHAAFLNGAAFLSAADALRGRRPVLVEWRGNAKPIDDELLPADLRVDHVYLVSCKYLSRIVANAAPARLFDGLLRIRVPAERTSWYEHVAPDELRALTEAACVVADVPTVGRVVDLDEHDRYQLQQHLRAKRWPEACADSWSALTVAVAERSATRWREAIATRDDQIRLLLRLLRIGPAPYFVLGVGPRGPLRLRVMTSWDWLHRYRLEEFEVRAKRGGQPLVEWHAVVRDRDRGRMLDVLGHVEIRWSHGRFKGAPEAKVYLDTPHADVPGYEPLS
jgi:hypothetical protein